MKKLIWLIPITAIAVCLVAFKTDKKQNFQSEEWFQYNGNINGSGPANPLNYTYNPSASCASGTAALCRIQVLSDGASTPHPNASALLAMQSEITSAIGNADTDDVKLKGS